MTALHPGHALGRDSVHGIQCAHDGGCFASGERQLTLYLKVAMIPVSTVPGCGQGRRAHRNRRLGRDFVNVIRQAIAQTHQGPPTEGAATGLGTTTARGRSSQRQYLPVAILGCFDYRAPS